MGLKDTVERSEGYDSAFEGSASKVSQLSKPAAKKTAFTPGPWKMKSFSSFHMVYSSGDEVIAALDSDDQLPADDDKANAHLIAAAPELLSVLLLAVPHIDCGDVVETAELINLMMDVVDKAKGGLNE